LISQPQQNLCSLLHWWVGTMGSWGLWDWHWERQWSSSIL